MKILKYEEASVGLIVLDHGGTSGVVKGIEDAHNIHVDLGDEGAMIACLVEGCEYYEPLYKKDTQ
jgi:hypothetical protein